MSIVDDLGDADQSRKAGQSKGVAKAYLNKALSSVKPSASASTASLVPIFLNENIARYLSNR